jgi:hypothetical protein
MKITKKIKNFFKKKGEMNSIIWNEKEMNSLLNKFFNSQENFNQLTNFEKEQLILDHIIKNMSSKLLRIEIENCFDIFSIKRLPVYNHLIVITILVQTILFNIVGNIKSLIPLFFIILVCLIDGFQAKIRSKLKN